MKKTLYTLIILLGLVGQCFGFMALHGGGVNSDTPMIALSCDDNTTGTVVVNTYGSNGSISGESNTSDIHTTDSIEGSGAFALDANDIVLAFPDASIFTDEVFTIQFSIKGDETGTASGYVRFVADSASSLRILRLNSDTAFGVTVGGTAGSFTVDDMDDGQWQTFRVVVDTGEATEKVKVFQKTGTGSWSSKGTHNAVGDITGFGGSMAIFGGESTFWGNTSGGNKGDGFILWDFANSPL